MTGLSLPSCVTMEPAQMFCTLYDAQFTNLWPTKIELFPFVYYSFYLINNYFL